MRHEIETMFSVRDTPWHGLGARVDESLNSLDAIRAAELDWIVNSEPIYSRSGAIDCYMANVRSTDKKVLGVVTDKYQIVQNHEAFAFTDSLISEGVTYESAGSLQGGRRIWLLAKLPEQYRVAGDGFDLYLLFSNSHNGSTGIKAAITPIRVLCKNTLNLALRTAPRMWMAKHTGDIAVKMREAKRALNLADDYIDKLNIECGALERVRITDDKVYDYIKRLIPDEPGASDARGKNIQSLRDDMAARFFDAPDLADKPKTALRFIHAVSDFTTHVEPLRKTPGYRENMFKRTTDGHPLLDRAYEIVLAS